MNCVTVVTMPMAQVNRTRMKKPVGIAVSNRKDENRRRAYKEGGVGA
jgi:hypothetical protein